MEVLPQDAMDLQLTINEVSLRLDQALLVKQLRRSGFRKRGFVRKLLGRQPRGQQSLDKPPLGKGVYDAENCTLFCFGEEFHLYACTDSYLDEDRQWETSALLIYSGGRLTEVQFAVIDGKIAASTFLERFLSVCEARFGPPQEDELHQFIWTGIHSQIHCALAPNQENASFVWTRRNESD